MASFGPKTRNTSNDTLTDTEQLQIMEAYAEAEDALFLDLGDDDYLFEPEE
ncbi:MAG: hypothetical protein HUJ59_02735 [Bacilli bacterium]|nr:hypothetical protein [Bacilli bacterium]